MITIIICHLTTYRVSCSRFSAIIFHDYFHYCGISLVRFLITIVLNIVSSLHIVFSFCARVGWCDAWTEFIKVDVDADVNEMPPRIFTRAVLHVVHTFYLFNRDVLILLRKIRTETQTFPST